MLRHRNYYELNSHLLYNVTLMFTDSLWTTTNAGYYICVPEEREREGRRHYGERVGRVLYILERVISP